MAVKMIVTTSDNVEGIPIAEYLGVVRGVSVRIPTLSQGFAALGQALSGNRLAGIELYAEVCETARAEAYRIMVDEAKKLEADAIVGVRYDSAPINIEEALTEVLAYGTAVKLKLEVALPV